MLKIILVASLVLVFASTTEAFAGREFQSESRPQKFARYACPMHPDVKSSRQGKCPKCGMKLRLIGNKADNPADPADEPAIEASADRASISSSRIPDVAVYDQEGKQIRFYSDLVKGKTVAINFIFTTCTTICPPLTATFRRVQQELAERAPQVSLISVSVDPTTDTPARLREFAAKFKAAPGWTFVTGNKVEIDSLLKALGVAVADKNDHTPMVLIGNEPSNYWTRAFGLSSPAALVKEITQAANQK